MYSRTKKGNKMNYFMRKFKKNTKALSPVVASIILIAVTVAVSVVVAAWMGGMTIGLMGNAEQVSITPQAVDSTHLSVNVRNTGGATITINPSGTLDNTVIAVTGYGAAPGTYTVAKGTAQTFTIALSTAIVDGAQYTLKMSTAKGTALTSVVTYTAP